MGKARYVVLLSLSLAACDDSDGDTPLNQTDAVVAADSGAESDMASASDGSPTPDAGPDAGPQTLQCAVAIVGGGAGGTHTAFRLAPTLGDGVCLFEREAKLGGRIKDVAFDDNDPTSPRVGTGARRVMETQGVLFALADELDITLETPPDAANLTEARGAFAFSKEALLPQYPGLMADAGGDTETALYDALRLGPERATTGNYPNFEAYVRAVVGDVGYDYLRDMSRFRADFEYDLDAEGYLDYLDEEWDVCCEPSYPQGGMSSFIFGMEARATADGARIFKGEAVTAVNKVADGYELTTANRTVHADKVVLAVPPSAFEQIGGDVADRIKAQPEFQAIVGVKVVTITQWWEDAWWSVIRNPMADTDANVWRAWTTEHCLNFIEIPIEPYAAAGKITRSVYDDNLDCAIFWEQLAAQGTEAVEAELNTQLTALFNNGVSDPATVEIPMPIKTFVQVWPDAWHWIKGGTGLSNAEVFTWSVAPLGEEPVSLVGEAYNVRRSGWSDGAYKSSIRVLNEKYGLTLNIPGSTKAARTHRRLWSQGRH